MLYLSIEIHVHVRSAANLSVDRRRRVRRTDGSLLPLFILVEIY